MTRRHEIDGQWFDEKVDGMTLVDSYYIPDEIVEEYIKDREYYAEKATEIFSKNCHKVIRDYKGSQDGEAIVGYTEEGKSILFIHLDPDGIAGMKDADKKGELEKYLLDN